MKTFLVFLFHNCITNLESKVSNLTPVDSCSMNEPRWRKKSQQYSCSSGMTYHCILAKNESAYELCIRPQTISQKDGCPQINFYKDEILFDSSHSECPVGNEDCPKGNETYQTDALYLFPACLQDVSNRNYSVKETKQTNDDASTSLSDLEEKNSNKLNTGLLVGLIIAVLIIIALVIILLLYTQRKRHGYFQTRVERALENLSRKSKGNNSCAGINGSAETGLSERPTQPEGEPFIGNKDRDNPNMCESQSAHKNGNGGRKINLKEGAIFDCTFNVRALKDEIMLQKDGKEVIAGKRVVKSDTQEGYRLIIFQLKREDEGEYTCSNTNTRETDIIQLKIEKATRAIYHHECIMSLTSIPHILFSIQQASRHAFQTSAAPIPKAVKKLRSSLDKIKREAYRVLTLSYDKIKRIQMLALEIEAVHLNGISEALRNQSNMDISGKVSKMAKDIQEGQKIIEETLNEVGNVKGLIDRVELKFASTLPTLSEDMSSCHKNLKNLFTKWTAYESFFSSMSFVILKGRSLTSDQDKAVQKHADALSQYDLEVLRIYVSSVRCSTLYYAEIYLSDIKQLVDDFYADELLDKESIDSLHEKIRERYDEMYERDSRASVMPAISNK